MPYTVDHDYCEPSSRDVLTNSVCMKLFFLRNGLPGASPTSPSPFLLSPTVTVVGVDDKISDAF